MKLSEHNGEVWVDTPYGPVPREALLIAAKHQTDEICGKLQSIIALLDVQLADLVHHLRLRNDAYLTVAALKMGVTLAELQLEYERRYHFTLDEMDRTYCGGYPNEVLQHALSKYAIALDPSLEAGAREHAKPL